jgi:hypothetical protein
VVAVLIMPHDLAHRPSVCRVLEREEHQRREGGEARRLELRQPFLDRVSYRALLVAVALASFGDETPSYCNVLPPRFERKA